MRIRGTIIVTAFFFFSFVFVVHAAEDRLARPSFAEQKLGGDLFRFDDVVEISAPVAGDLYAAGRDVLLRGDVAGDVLAVGRSVVVRGDVAGDVRVVAETVTIEGSVGGNVSIAAREMTMGQNAQIGKNLTVVSEYLTIASTVNGDAQLFLWGAENAHIQKNAVVKGRTTLHSSVPPLVDDGALFIYPIERHEPVFTQPTLGSFLFRRIVTFFSLLLIGLVVIHIALRPALVIASFMTARSWQDVPWGMLFLFLPPLVAVALAFTVIGIPLAVILFALWGIVVYSARVLAGLTIGLALLSFFDKNKRLHSPIVPLTLGLLVLVALSSLPIAGSFVALIATLWSLGGMIRLVRTLAAHQPKA